MFKLSRYYSVASLIGVAVVIVALSFFFRHLAMQTLVNHQTRANLDLTRSFANSIWDEFSEFVDLSMSFTSADELLRKPELSRLQALTEKQMKGTQVVKVKIFNLNGITVFSTDPGQIGKDKSNTAGYLQAKAGQVISEITFRDKFHALEQVISDRNLIASYIPVREQENGPVVAVFEVYSDVTALIDELASAQRKITAGVFSLLALLYLFLFGIVKRADNIIETQELARKENEDKIRHQAYHDSLTGLPNRDSFVERMEEAISRAKRHQKNGAIMFLDLDRFKLVNDSLGHDAGDQLLRVTASRIQKCMRETDLAFRISGDEFMVIMEDLERGEGAAILANRILKTMTKPVALDSHEVIVNMSIGITTFPKAGCDIEELVKEADSAMYRAKQTGQNQFEFYSSEMNMIASERLSMETDLQKAIQKEQFVLFYQPKVHTHSRAMTSVEALLRWNHPEKGLIPPNEFIPVLEDTGLITTVGDWVISTACLQTQAWITAGLQPLRMSVNISARQFRNRALIDSVREALKSSGLSPQYLELELTESMFVEDTDYAISVMHELKELGVVLSIDDFGSGYSSLSYLKRFPVDYLKIDRSFIRDLAINDKDVAITSAISALAHSLNLGLIAEGVEDEHQVDLLKEKGCQELQGFLFSKPVPADELEKKLLKSPPSASGWN